MMMNIFNIFDPSTSMNFSLNWLSLMIIFFLFSYQYWFIPSRNNFLWIYILNYLFKEFKILLKTSLSNLIIFLTLFTYILLNNFLGLFPYIFTASSHMSFCLTLSLNLWMSIMLYFWLNFYNLMFCHLVPSFTPFFLMPFMVLIELISLMIRPITLSIRLTANMIAGHLLLSLLGSSGNLINSYYLMIIMMSIQILLYILEISVSLIQAYVFSILSLLYSSEI
uniref:ATP synthase F0 subunit 6 n=1 Tax=Pachycondyla annamita TaxID=613577 RepID=UPI002551EC40|nr:ATP synthase F0 subunit 6 [Pachycondyla annamita]WGF22857.1 ATP synthase F0 subunit 6 [Pachycondyla annamita]